MTGHHGFAEAEAAIFPAEGCGWPSGTSGTCDLATPLLRSYIDSLSTEAVDIAVITNQKLSDLNALISTDVTGPGRLLLAPEKGVALFEVQSQNLQLLWRAAPSQPDTHVLRWLF